MVGVECECKELGAVKEGGADFRATWRATAIGAAGGGTAVIEFCLPVYLPRLVLAGNGEEGGENKT